MPINRLVYDLVYDFSKNSNRIKNLTITFILVLVYRQERIFSMKIMNEVYTLLLLSMQQCFTHIRILIYIQNSNIGFENYFLIILMDFGSEHTHTCRYGR